MEGFNVWVRPSVYDPLSSCCQGYTDCRPTAPGDKRSPGPSRGAGKPLLWDLLQSYFPGHLSFLPRIWKFYSKSFENYQKHLWWHQMEPDCWWNGSLKLKKPLGLLETGWFSSSGPAALRHSRKIETVVNEIETVLKSECQIQWKFAQPEV